ncbi:MAG TPA: hypothetical protein VM582_05225 [Candidatus Thermoplasmatota archaeon]|nr:hypothetical protein [Candidatus Thermoplasmatota archaeon]
MIRKRFVHILVLTLIAAPLSSLLAEPAAGLSDSGRFRDIGVGAGWYCGLPVNGNPAKCEDKENPAIAQWFEATQHGAIDLVASATSACVLSTSGVTCRGLSDGVGWINASSVAVGIDGDLQCVATPVEDVICNRTLRAFSAPGVKKLVVQDNPTSVCAITTGGAHCVMYQNPDVVVPGATDAVWLGFWLCFLLPTETTPTGTTLHDIRCGEPGSLYQDLWHHLASGVEEADWGGDAMCYRKGSVLACDANGGAFTNDRSRVYSLSTASARALSVGGWGASFYWCVLSPTGVRECSSFVP